MTRFYLDTSAHIERWTGEASVKQRVGELLAGENHATSTHVLREWKHVIEGGCVQVLNAFRSGTADTSELFSHLSQGWGRGPKRALRVLSLLTGGTGFAGADAQIRARSILRLHSRVMFEHRIDEVRNGSDCQLAKERVQIDRSGRLELRQTIRRRDATCRQDDFIEVRLPQLRAIGRALEASADQAYVTMGRLALKLADDAAQRKGKNCYGGIGDVSVALECAANEVLLTSDRIFEVICPALGLKVELLTATAGP